MVYAGYIIVYMYNNYIYNLIIVIFVEKSKFLILII